MGLARGVVFLKCAIICKNMPLLVKQNKDFHKNALFQNAFKLLEQPTGGIPKNSFSVNLVKIVESLGKY